jgi:signal transduction histidine kinase
LPLPLPLRAVRDTDAEDALAAATETALRESEARVRAATEGTGLAIIEHDFACGAVWIEAGSSGMLSELLPSRIWIDVAGPDYAAFAERIHPEDRAAYDAALGAVACGTEVGFTIEFRLQRAIGGWAWLQCHGTLLDRDPGSGKPRRLRGVLRDVTEQRRLEQELRQAQKLQALGQLAGGIAHDVNNVLQSVASAASLIARQAEDPEPVRRTAQMIVTAAERGASITDRVLAFARRGDLRPAALDPAQVLKGLREILAPALGGRFTIRVEAEAGLPKLLANKGQLETAVINLATNARDAMRNGGTLILSAAEDRVKVEPAWGELAAGRYIRLSVRDNGEGMDAATLTRVAEPFFTTKPAGKGTGLGLAMVKGFVEQSHGAFRIDSAPGQGTTVMLWLPQE